MAECPGCGAQMHFDIKTQELKCDNCGKQLDPYEYDKGVRIGTKVSDADALVINDTAGKKQEDDDTFTVSVFTCPQCGGEIISTSNAAAEFCTYCGASVILQDRLDKAKKPDYIIPFKKDKADCRKSCAGKMKRAIFAPHDMVDPKGINSFRGIYMPYWIYDIKREGPLCIEGTKSHNEGDYEYTDHYKLTGESHINYNGLSFDASSSFSDNISESIAPFNSNDAKKFSPSYISGFYADTSDVNAQIYNADAIKLVTGDIIGKVEKKPVFKDYLVKQSQDILEDGDVTYKSALFPVWFMSYRKNNRVAYAAINGQTGKLAMDMPIDSKKYIIWSLLLAVPVFIILNNFFMSTAVDTLSFTAVILSLAVILYSSEANANYNREKHYDDKGYLCAQKAAAEGENKAAANTEKLSDKQLKKKRRAEKKEAEENLDKCDANAEIHVIFAIIALVIIKIFGAVIGLLVYIACALIEVFIMNDDSLAALNKKKLILSFLTLAASEIMVFAAPIYDEAYYALTIIMIIVIMILMVSVIEKYNILSTRKLPQFRREGGDNRA